MQPSDLEVGMCLCTNNPDRIGNCFIIEVADTTVTLLTDFGNKVIWTKEELLEGFYVPDWWYEAKSINYPLATVTERVVNQLELLTNFLRDTDMSLIKFKLLEGATLPERGSAQAAGFDVRAAETVIIPAGLQGLVSTGVILSSCPANTYLRVAPRSKLANKFGIDVMAGVVDADYRGEIGVILRNHGTEDFQVTPEIAIAQLIPERILPCEVMAVGEVSESERGDAGITSTNLRMAGGTVE